MHIELQAKLLRVIEQGEFIKLGDEKTTKVSVRIIAATNKDLKKAIEEGLFREDLFYRLNVFTINLPALRERKEDIPELANYYLSFFSEKTNKRFIGINAEANKVLQHYNWKGNIRELKNTIERAVILEDGEWITQHSLPSDMQFQSENNPAGSYELAEIERQHILKVLLHTKGNKTEAARLLNIGLTTLYRKIEEYKL